MYEIKHKMVIQLYNIYIYIKYLFLFSVQLKPNPKIPGGRDHLMWSLLQFLSGTIAKNPVSDFQPVLRLIGK